VRRFAGPDDEALFDLAEVAQQILRAHSTALPRQAAGEPSKHAVDAATEHGLIPDGLSDRGNAKLFVSLYGRDFRYVPGLGWYRWCGYRWEIDDDTVLWAAGELAESLAEVASTGRHTTTALRRHRHRALSTPGIKAMLTQAKATPGMILSAALLDADPYALCTPAGVVELHTGTLAPPDPERHYHARSTTVAPQLMPIPRWQRFLTDTFGEDAERAEMISFLHELFGYSITGDVGAQIMPFLYGVGKNGKSVLLDVMVKLLGDYADAAPPGFLMARPFEGHPADLAELHGRRIVVCSELKPGDRFDEARSSCSPAATVSRRAACGRTSSASTPPTSSGCWATIVPKWAWAATRSGGG
jgi:putative DNA primase/helicase